jgi:RNA polymerase sigma-70 factor, ECF subfamily
MTVAPSPCTFASTQTLPDLYTELHAELHRIARSFLRNERTGHTLQPSALINEAYLRMVETRTQPAVDRSHFLRLAARAMRQVLIDYSRSHRAQKRDKSLFIPEIDNTSSRPLASEEYLAIDAALLKLEIMDPRQSEIVELRFFGGLSVAETAGALGISEKTVKREWSMARAWLLGELENL